jgi:hypothetical protein
MYMTIHQATFNRAIIWDEIGILFLGQVLCKGIIIIVDHQMGSMWENAEIQWDFRFTYFWPSCLAVPLNKNHWDRFSIKGSVQRKLRWVENGVNISVGASDCGAGHSFFRFIKISSWFCHISVSGQYCWIYSSGQISEALRAT